jgi:AraC-like DNA-binding protein
MAESPITRSQLLVSTGFDVGVGAFHLAGTIKQSGGAGVGSMRVLGRYAAVLLAHGRGRYADANGVSGDLTAGDLVIVFPEIPHRYGPGRGDEWDEFYVVFSGPAFDLWRSEGIVTPERPILRLGAVHSWLERGLTLVDRCESASTAEQIKRICGLLEMLADASPTASPPPVEPRWLSRTKALLRSRLSDDLELEAVARAAGMSYESFRKRFTKELGTSPAQYRMRAKIVAADELLSSTDQSLRQIALTLGFSDEFHFSHRFKASTGESPRERRSQLKTARDKLNNSDAFRTKE